MSLRNLLQNFDYRVGCDDFFLYELARLIEEDRATFEDDEFRRVIDAGIHEHIERRLDLRADIAKLLRIGKFSRDRVLHSVEDIESSLIDIPEILESYTAYLFKRLEQCADQPTDDRITAAADRLLESPDDRSQAEQAIETLGSVRSAVSARVLAYVISEPMLDEDLELKAYRHARSMWPHLRPYILYALKPHAHEDVPFRWFELMIECDEPSAVDRILEEVLVHVGDPRYREDLLALIQLLANARDPETEEKILQVINDTRTPRAAVEMLASFLKTTRIQKHFKSNSPWAALDRAYVANRQYLAAAKLLDAGNIAEAKRTLDELLQEDPQYPFALMLRSLS